MPDGCIRNRCIRRHTVLSNEHCRKEQIMTECETCSRYTYDDDEEAWGCDADFDEDDMARMWQSRRERCPYWHSNDEYRTVKHQAVGHLPGYSDEGRF